MKKESRLPEWLTVEDVAEYLKVSTRTVHRWRSEMGLPATKLGRTLRFRSDELLRWIEREGADEGEAE